MICMNCISLGLRLTGTQDKTKLSSTAIPSLNDWLVEQAEQIGYAPRWQNMRLVAADASTVRFGLRASHVPGAACVDQIAFGLFLRMPK
jgi:hypothetical protein